MLGWEGSRTLRMARGSLGTPIRGLVFPWLSHQEGGTGTDAPTGKRDHPPWVPESLGKWSRAERSWHIVRVLFLTEKAAGVPEVPSHCQDPVSWGKQDTATSPESTMEDTCCLPSPNAFTSVAGKDWQVPGQGYSVSTELGGQSCCPRESSCMA